MVRDNHDDKNKIKRRKVSSSDRNTTSQTSNNSNGSRSRSRSSNNNGSGRFKGIKTLGLVFLVTRCAITKSIYAGLSPIFQSI